MKSSFSSCFTTLILAVAVAAFVRFTLPPVWNFVTVLLTGTILVGSVLFLLALLGVGFFTYRNLKRNKSKTEAQKYARVSRTENLYCSIVTRLEQNIVLNQVTAEELLQSEVLITDKLGQIKEDLIRLKEFASSKNEKLISQQMREYEQQMRETSDQGIRELVHQNMKMLEEKRQRFEQAREEIRQKEGLADLLYNNLLNADENLKFGRPVTRLLPAEVYNRFGITPPSDQQQLPPFVEKSSTSKES